MNEKRVWLEDDLKEIKIPKGPQTPIPICPESDVIPASVCLEYHRLKLTEKEDYYVGEYDGVTYFSQKSRKS